MQKTASLQEAERVSRLKHIRSAPLSAALFDHLMVVEKYFENLPCIPASHIVGNVFIGIPDEVVQKLALLQQCAEAAAHLQLLETNAKTKVKNMNSVRQAADIYNQEMVRLLSGLFHLEHAFWGQYYNRWQKRTPNLSRSPASQKEDDLLPAECASSLYLVTLDAIHYCTNLKHNVAYQLMQQSLKWAMAGYYTTSYQLKFEAYQNALTLVDSFDLPDYKAWLIEQISEPNS